MDTDYSHKQVPGNNSFLGNNPAGIASAGLNAVGTGVGMIQDVNQTTQFDVNSSLPGQTYHPYYQPPTYYKSEVPEEISEGTGFSSAISNSAKGAAAGTAILPGIGTAIGAGVGLISGVIKGEGARKKREEFKYRQNQQYMDYLHANNRYYDNKGQMSRDRAQAKSLQKRSENIVPSLNSNIYGYL